MYFGEFKVKLLYNEFCKVNFKFNIKYKSFYVDSNNLLMLIFLVDCVFDCIDKIDMWKLINVVMYCVFILLFIVVVSGLSW